MLAAQIFWQKDLQAKHLHVGGVVAAALLTEGFCVYMVTEVAA
jgi:hypothetical protein